VVTLNRDDALNKHEAQSGGPAAKPETPEDLPDPNARLPGVIIYSHSDLLYWWPVWLTGFILAAVSYMFGQAFTADDGRIEWIHPNSGVGVIFVIVLLSVIILTNARLRGIASVLTLVSMALVAVSLGWLGILDDVLSAIPKFSIFMSAGFYFTFSAILFVVWALAFFVFDRLTYWRVRPGQMTKENWIGGGERSFDVRGLLFEKHGEDYFRHFMLGLGSGDLCLKTAGAAEQTIEIPNVTMVDRKVAAIQRLIAVKHLRVRWDCPAEVDLVRDQADCLRWTRHPLRCPLG
jgi:hypothetical protein